ncbi:MAG: peptidylprolyl isomerase [SAR86 cluster bacterium]|uniref:Peptidyl-prolyl cis-trans isomerase n=1 Tax=SAR86 cluster bacterium TaxID=2030880 RepID=A0A2A5CFF2_9GAMM|nr:FKBP-type peptidyl-prolyl cis-trans isomerase [Gammaproteobacteria bacterium AH-315-E17]PCJ42599.1 MAG: peptidylprolyl isomerase [SAR86 cluster bacterium]
MSKPADNSENGNKSVSENKSNKNSDFDLLRVINLNAEVESEADSKKLGLKDYPEDEVSPGKLITLNFSLAPTDNPTALIDSNFDKGPVSFKYGDGNILTGFEDAMIGLKAGDKKSFTVNAEQAFGLRNEDNIHCYPRYQFPADLLIEKGLMISFSDVGGNEQAGVIAEFNADEVKVDFNHPLADIDILFTVDIKAVKLI